MHMPIHIAQAHAHVHAYAHAHAHNHAHAYAYASGGVLRARDRMYAHARQNDMNMRL